MASIVLLHAVNSVTYMGDNPSILMPKLQAELLSL